MQVSLNNFCLRCITFHNLHKPLQPTFIQLLFNFFFLFCYTLSSHDIMTLVRRKDIDCLVTVVPGSGQNVSINFLSFKLWCWKQKIKNWTSVRISATLTRANISWLSGEVIQSPPKCFPHFQDKAVLNY